MPFYDDDLAYIHDVGYSGVLRGYVPGLLALLDENRLAGGTVLDVGCGGGQWADELARAGFQPRGIDISQAMIQLARKRLPTGEFEVASAWTYDYPPCDAITALGEVFSYRAPGAAGSSTYRPSSLFRKLFASLSPGGLLVFDVGEIGLSRGRAPACVVGDDWTCVARFRYDDKRHRLTRDITSFRQVGELYRRCEEQHVLQLYRPADIAKQLRAAGFRVRQVRRIGDSPLMPKRVGFVARKPR